MIEIYLRSESDKLCRRVLVGVAVVLMPPRWPDSLQKLQRRVIAVGWAELQVVMVLEVLGPLTADWEW